jgi:hypothetical protein
MWRRRVGLMTAHSSLHFAHLQLLVPEHSSPGCAQVVFRFWLPRRLVLRGISAGGRYRIQEVGT